MKQIKEILKIGVPIMLGQACVIIVAFADNIMIGWHNVDELAAASFVNNVLNLVILMGLGFSTGLTPMIGAFNGVNDVKSIGSTMKNGILVNGVIGLVSLVVLSVIYCFLDRFGQAPELLPLIRPYFIIVGISSFFQLGFNVLKQFTDGMRQPVVSMVFLIIGNVVNIFGNWVLIYGKLGFPELGLNGAGLSTLLARALMLGMFALYVFKGKKFSQHVVAFKASHLSKDRMKHIFSLGYPVAIQNGLEASTFSFSAIMIGWLGVVELAAHQVVTTISLLFFLLLQGLSFAVSILVLLRQKGLRWRAKIHQEGFLDDADHICHAFRVALHIPIPCRRHFYRFDRGGIDCGVAVLPALRLSVWRRFATMLFLRAQRHTGREAHHVLRIY